MAARTSPRRSWTGWLVACLGGFAAGVVTAWAVAALPIAAAQAPPDFPQRRIAQSEWLRGAPAPPDWDAMIRRPGRR